MDVSDDEAMPESFHGVAEDVPADCLDDIFYEFRPVGFNAFPFLCGTHAFIGDRGIAIDRKMVEEAIALDEISKNELSETTCEMTSLDNPNSVCR